MSNFGPPDWYRYACPHCGREISIYREVPSGRVYCLPVCGDYLAEGTGECPCVTARRRTALT